MAELELVILHALDIALSRRVDLRVIQTTPVTPRDHWLRSAQQSQPVEYIDNALSLAFGLSCALQQRHGARLKEGSHGVHLWSAARILLHA